MVEYNSISYKSILALNVCERSLSMRRLLNQALFSNGFIIKLERIYRRKGYMSYILKIA